MAEIPACLWFTASDRKDGKFSYRRGEVLFIGALPSEVNVGYVEFEDSIVDTVDGQKVASLSHLVELLENRDGESHRIMFEDGEYEVVLRHEDVDSHSQEILDRYRIPSDRSPDLLAMKPSPAVDPPTATATDTTTDAPTDEPSTTPTSAASQ